MKINQYINAVKALRGQYQGKLIRVAKKIVDFEVAAVTNALANTGFKKWLDGFYPKRGQRPTTNTRFMNFANKTLSPVAKEYMLRAGKLAEELTERAAELTEKEFEALYVRDYTLRHGSSSRRQILSQMAKAEDLDAAKVAVATRLEEWLERRGVAIGADEVIREAGAASREAWRRRGVVKLIWRLTGPGCPICKYMSGAVVGIEKPFLEDKQVIYAPYEKKSQEAEPEVFIILGDFHDGFEDDLVDEVEELRAKGYLAFKSYGAKYNSPIHKGCLCHVVPEI